MKNENDTGVFTTADFIREMLTDEQESSEFAEAYLQSAVLASAVDALRNARRNSGLKQADIARKLNTRQPAVTRWEADTSGAMSLRKYFDFAVACGKVPLTMLADVSSVVSYVSAHPGELLLADAFLAWQQAVAQSVPPSGNTLQEEESDRPSCTSSTLTIQDSKYAAEEADRYLRTMRHKLSHDQLQRTHRLEQRLTSTPPISAMQATA